FFPIKWSEDDQVSNVKMVSQAIDILGMLGAYVVNKKKFATKEFRANTEFKYEADLIYRKES
ncbi:MAG: glycosyltransferase family 2 protein, partial [Eubacteriales bacterium]